MLCKTTCFVLVAVMTMPLAASELLGPGLDDYDRETGIVSDSLRSLDYELYRPPGYEELTDAPLVVYLHGSMDGIAENNSGYLYPKIGDLVHTMQRENRYRLGPGPAADEADEAYAGYLLVPKIPIPGSWSSYGQLAHELAQDIATRYDVDQRRIYLVGYSDGGFATPRLIEQYPGVYAAGVSIAGGGVVTDERLEALKSTPFYFIHDLQDTVVPSYFSTELHAALLEIGAPTNLLTTDGAWGHGSFVLAFRRNTPVIPWIFEQQLIPEPASVTLLGVSVAIGMLTRRRR